MRWLQDNEIYIVRWKENKNIIIKTKDERVALYWKKAVKDNKAEIVIRKFKTLGGK